VAKGNFTFSYFHPLRFAVICSANVFNRDSIVKKEWLTPEELAAETGYSRQTVNKWIKRENWTTTPKPGVQGGKARLIHIDERVKNFIQSTRNLNEPSATYGTAPHSLPALLISSVQQMSQAEQDQFTALILREGIKGVLQRLGINEE